MKILARIISYLFHPLLFPTYAAILIIAANPNMFGYFGEKVHVVWLIIVFALTFVFPVVWLLMMRRMEMIETLSLETPKDRIIPFIATATFYLWAAWMFKPNVNMKIPSNELIFYMMVGCCLTIFIAFFINIFSKISIHAIAAGSLMGLMLPLIRMSTYDLRFVFLAVVLFAGLVGTARLILKAHTEKEIFSGYFIGFTGQFLAFSIISKFL